MKGATLARVIVAANHVGSFVSFLYTADLAGLPPHPWKCEVPQFSRCGDPQQDLTPLFAQARTPDAPQSGYAQTWGNGLSGEKRLDSARSRTGRAAARCPPRQVMNHGLGLRAAGKAAPRMSVRALQRPSTRPLMGLSRGSDR